MNNDRQKNTLSFKIGLAISAVMHALLIAGAIFFADLPPPIDLNKNTVQVSLVKLGKVHDQTLLPKKEAEPLAESTRRSPEPAQPPVAKKNQVEVATKKKQQAVAKPKLEKLNVPAKKQTPKLSDRLSRLTKTWSDEGRQDGHALGRELQGNLQANYEQEVRALLEDSYELPAILSQEERRRLRVLVRLYIGASGQIVQIKIEQPSGKLTFDNAVLAGAKKVGNVSQPPLNLRRKYAQEGMLLEFVP